MPTIENLASFPTNNLDKQNRSHHGPCFLSGLFGAVWVCVCVCFKYSYAQATDQLPLFMVIYFDSAEFNVYNTTANFSGPLQSTRKFIEEYKFETWITRIMQLCPHNIFTYWPCSLEMLVRNWTRIWCHASLHRLAAWRHCAMLSGWLACHCWTPPLRYMVWSMQLLYQRLHMHLHC